MKLNGTGVSRRKLLRNSLAGASGLLLRLALARADSLREVTRNLSEFSPATDGVTVLTATLQRAVDAVAMAGGGTLVVPAGRWVTGTLMLKSGVTLRLERDAVLLGSTSPADYKPVDAFLDAVDVMRGYALIAASDAHDVGIVGEGRIDGRAKELQANGQTPAAKPFLVRWVRSTRITVSGVTLENSSAWTMHCFQCADVHYSGIRIHSFGVENNDGIDIDSSQRVTVEDCFVESQDDAICLKSTSAKPCSQIRVTGCTVRTHHGGLKIGTESMGDIYDVVFDRNHVIDAREGAVKFCAEDGGSVHDVTVSKLTVELADTPIFLRLGGRMRTYREGDPKLSFSTMKRITLKDIQIADSTRVGMLITGFPGHAIEDVTIENLYVKMKGELNSLAEGDLRLPEAVKDYPEVWMFGPLIPAYGVYVRHAVGVTMRRTEFKVELPDQRPAFVLEDVQRSAIQGCDLTGSSNSSWMATLRDCRDVTLHAVTTQARLDEMVRVQGSSSAAIRLGELKAPSGTLVKLEAGAEQQAIDR